MDERKLARNVIDADSKHDVVLKGVAPLIPTIGGQRELIYLPVHRPYGHDRSWFVCSETDGERQYVERGDHDFLQVGLHERLSTNHRVYRCEVASCWFSLTAGRFVAGGSQRQTTASICPCAASLAPIKVTLGDWRCLQASCSAKYLGA